MFGDLLVSIPAPVLLLLGGVLLLWSAEKLVGRAEHLATSLSVPKAIVGAVVLGFGTSLPELLVCVNFLLDGDPGSAIGNAVGSNLANVGLVLGGTAVLAPVVVERGMLRLELPLAAAAAVFLLVWAQLHDTITWHVGVGFLAVFVGFLLISLARTKRHQKATVGPDPRERRVLSDSLWILATLAGVAAGAEAFTAGAGGLAVMLGVPSEVIGLSIVAFGTSLPEVVTTFSAARQGHPELAVGNIAGSNVFNLLFVLGVCATLLPLEMSAEMRRFDFWFLVAASFLTLPWLLRARTIGRVQGLVAVSLYVGYMVFLFSAGRTG